MMTIPKPQLVDLNSVSIPQTEDFDIEAFKSTRLSGQPRIGKLAAALPIYRFGEVKDFWRVHPDPAYRTDPLCLVNVPIKDGHDTLHLIRENLADEHLAPSQVTRHCLVLACKPNDVCFFGRVPHENLDNAYNADVVTAIEQARNEWLMLASRRNVGGEGYVISVAMDQDFVDPPNWPTQPMNALLALAFKGRLIFDEKHPAMLRLLGRKQKLD